MIAEFFTDSYVRVSNCEQKQRKKKMKKFRRGTNEMELH